MKETFTQEQYLEIEAYLLDEMEADQRTLFEAKLNEQEDLRLMLAECSSMQQGIFQFFTRQQLNQITLGLEEEGFFIDEMDIEDYCLGRLDPLKLPLFEKKLQNDPLFAQQVANFEAMLQGIANFQEGTELKSSLNKLTTELEQESFFEEKTPDPVVPEIRRNKSRIIALFKIYRLAIAACLVLLLGFVVWMQTGNKLRRIENLAIRSTLPEEKLLPGVLEKLNEQGYVPAEQIFAPEELKKGLELYQQKQFQQAYQILKSYVKQYPTVEIGQFYLGVASLHVKDFRTAEQCFNVILKKDQSNFSGDAQWFLAIVELRTNPDNGKQRLKEIAQNANSPFQNTAKELLNRFRL